MSAQGTFILADISGYTRFVASMAIEHSNEIIAHLLNAMLKANSGHWKVANIEGDCVFFYREGREDPPVLLQEARKLYETFCEEIIDISARAACPCGACTTVNQLGLKFIVHAGEFEVQEIGDRSELMGTDVVAAHCLLKNTVALREYVLLTRAYADDVTALELPAAEGSDEYDVIGAIEYVYLDLEPVRQDVEARNCFFLSPDQAPAAATIDIDAPPELVWEAMVSPDKQVEYFVGVSDIQILPSPHGEVGQIHRCTLQNGNFSVWVLTAMDQAAHRMTFKWFAGDRKDIYQTWEVSEGPGGGSRVGLYMTFQEPNPEFPQLMERVLQAGAIRLKNYCEAEVRSS
jgi:hypothetical protein